MKKIILLLFGVILWSNPSFAQEANAKQKSELSHSENSNTLTSEQKKKADQLNALRVKCPHYPRFQSESGGVHKNLNDSFIHWKTNYPKEYEAYQKIFGITN